MVQTASILECSWHGVAADDMRRYFDIARDIYADQFRWLFDEMSVKHELAHQNILSSNVLVAASSKSGRVIPSEKKNDTQLVLIPAIPLCSIFMSKSRTVQKLPSQSSSWIRGKITLYT
jgi:hypothetical protein